MPGAVGGIKQILHNKSTDKPEKPTTDDESKELSQLSKFVAENNDYVSLFNPGERPNTPTPPTGKVDPEVAKGHGGSCGSRSLSSRSRSDATSPQVPTINGQPPPGIVISASSGSLAASPDGQAPLAPRGCHPGASFFPPANGPATPVLSSAPSFRTPTSAAAGQSKLNIIDRPIPQRPADPKISLGFRDEIADACKDVFSDS